MLNAYIGRPICNVHFSHFLYWSLVFTCVNMEFYNKMCPSSNLLRDTRSSVLEESLQKLGVEKLSQEDVQKMQWEVLEAKIGNWIHFMRIAVRIFVISQILIRFLRLWATITRRNQYICSYDLIHLNRSGCFLLGNV